MPGDSSPAQGFFEFILHFEPRLQLIIYKLLHRRLYWNELFDINAIYTS